MAYVVMAYANTNVYAQEAGLQHSGPVYDRPYLPDGHFEGSLR